MGVLLYGQKLRLHLLPFYLPLISCPAQCRRQDFLSLLLLFLQIPYYPNSILLFTSFSKCSVYKNGPLPINEIFLYNHISSDLENCLSILFIFPEIFMHIAVQVPSSCSSRIDAVSARYRDRMRRILA